MRVGAKATLLGIGILLCGLAGAVYGVMKQEEFGADVEGERLQRIHKSPLFDGKRLENSPPQSRNMEWLRNLKLYMGGQVREPQFEVPVLPMSSAQLEKSPSSGLSAVWLGHASVLIEIDGHRLITDPVLSDIVSPVPYIYGPKRLHAAPIAIADLKAIDAVLISHDHYDHLDMATIKSLASQGSAFYVPLGIGAHLERWGVRPEKIHEMEWWDSLSLGNLSIHCTPARHYSGRKSMDNSTLWSSWFVASPQYSVYFSGDTGYSTHFADIRRRLGAVDLTLMKIGAYGEPEGWVDIHMTPESAVKAHQELAGKIMLPIHWATFNLAYHSWEEPIERALEALKSTPGVELITPRVGERFEFGQPFHSRFWFRND